MKYMSLFAIFLFILSCKHEVNDSVSQQTLGQCLPNDKNCDFYDCFEKKKSCGSRGYVKGYVQPYCEKFLKNCPNFFGTPRFKEERAQKWLVGTRKCLQDELLPNVEKSCEEIRNAGFKSHVYCYLDGSKQISGVGFCDLTATTWIEVANCINTGLIGFEGASQILDVFSTCAPSVSLTSEPPIHIPGDILEYNQPISDTPEIRGYILQRLSERLTRSN